MNGELSENTLFGELTSNINVDVNIDANNNNLKRNYQLVYSTDFNFSTTSTSAVDVGEYTVPGIYDKNKIIYIRIRDKAGKRANYFLESVALIFNYRNANNNTSTITNPSKIITSYSSSNLFTQTTSLYGIYVYSLSSDGEIVLKARCSSNYAPTIDGTYSLEVYKLDFPDGSPFNL